MPAWLSFCHRRHQAQTALAPAENFISVDTNALMMVMQLKECAKTDHRSIPPEQNFSYHTTRSSRGARIKLVPCTIKNRLPPLRRQPVDLLSIYSLRKIKYARKTKNSAYMTG
ncbi:hypothetical protein BBOR36S_04579 [Brevibacillus borstelensis]